MDCPRVVVPLALVFAAIMLPTGMMRAMASDREPKAEPSTSPARAEVTQEVSGSQPTDAGARLGTYYIAGKVEIVPPEFPQAVIDRLATSTATSNDQIHQILQNGSPPKAGANVVVTLQGESMTSQTVTDSQGQFKFTQLARGEYQLFAEMHSQEWGRIAAAPARERLDGEQLGRFPTLQLRSDLIRMRGRVIDANGEPVAGAKVTAIEVENPHVQYPGDAFDPAIYSAVSDGNGFYEVRDVPPIHPIRLLPYLNKGKPITGKPPRPEGGFDIHVEAPGLVQSKDNVPRVYDVSEVQVDLARRLFKALAQAERNSGQPEHHAKEGLYFPPSKGNAMLVEDIVLQAPPAATQPATTGR
jgi:hypothetical protein